MIEKHRLVFTYKLYLGRINLKLADYYKTGIPM